MKVRGSATLEACAAASRTTAAPGIAAASAAPCASHGIDTSASPLMTSVGASIRGSSGVPSKSRNAAQQPA